MGKLRSIHFYFFVLILTLAGAGRTVCAACEANCIPAPFASMYSDSEVFSTAIANSELLPLRGRTLTGVTVPHHLLAADLIAKTFRIVDSRGIDKVIVLFPDHFKRTRLPFATTRRDFQTVFGTIPTSRSDVSILLESPDLVEESGLFAKDHGIGAVLPFIKHFLPNAEVLPIAVSIRSRRAEWDRLAALLTSIIGPSTLIVQSTDFSHYLPLSEAVQHDQEVLNSLAAEDLDAIANLRQPQHTDSRGAQYLQLKLNTEFFHAHPTVLFNANFQNYSDEQEERTTSYIVQIYEPAAGPIIDVDREGSKVYCFAGDTFFGRGVAADLANPFAASRTLNEIKSYLNGCRLILNLEGVVLSKVPKNPGPTKLAMSAGVTVKWLRALNVAAVGVANNHAMDFGEQGYNEMVRSLDRAGITILRRGSVVDVGSFRLVALTDLDNHSGRRSDVTNAADFKTLSRSIPPIVDFMHWGIEHFATPGNRQRALADDLAKAGITLIVGAHPHVASSKLLLVNGMGTINAYSLGNFVFDQSARHASGSILEVRVFDQGTFFARLLPVPNFFDHMRSEGFAPGDRAM
jgi:AmmeMemoRadiSam system protein B